MNNSCVAGRSRLIWAIGVATLACLALMVGSFVITDSYYFWFMSWNLLLAFVPLALSVWLVRILTEHLWSSWRALTATFLWLIFLPNSFYVVSDLIHLKHVPDDQLMYQAAMITSFAILSFVFGVASLAVVHEQLLKRIKKTPAAVVMATIILLSSFAIYLGRDLRWNSWDMFINLPSLLFDVSERFLHPSAHPMMFSITGGFFLLTGGIYVAYWQCTRLTQSPQPQITKSRPKNTLSSSL